MPNKVTTSFRININEVQNVVKKYPSILQIIKQQIESLKATTVPPLIEQVNPIIDWLNCYCETHKHLLDILEKVLSTINDFDIPGKESLFNKLGSAKDNPNFNSAYSELFLAYYFICNDIKIHQLEPKTSRKGKLADYSIHLGDDLFLSELRTPHVPNYDFKPRMEYLFDKLERIESDGLFIRVSGFESFDSSDIENLWKERVPLPSQNQLDEIISNFRKYAYDIKEEELPIDLPPLCSKYPRIKIQIDSKLPNEKSTIVAMSSSRTAEGLPLRRIVNLIKDERKHFNREDNILIFIDFSEWIEIAQIYLDHPYYRELITNTIKENIPSSIDGVFSYIRGNDGELIHRSVLCLNPKSPILNKPAFINFIEIWDQYKPIY